MILFTMKDIAEKYMVKLAMILLNILDHMLQFSVAQATILFKLISWTKIYIPAVILKFTAVMIMIKLK